MFNDEEGWKAQRRYVLKTLKDFGFGRKGLEGVLVEEADRMGEYFREKDGQPTLVVNLFNVAILNVLWQIVANHRKDVSRSVKDVALSCLRLAANSLISILGGDEGSGGQIKEKKLKRKNIPEYRA